MARRGLTLIELLVVVGAIGMLLALSLPALMRARDQAQSAVCAQNQKSLAIAWLMYKDDNDDRLVGGYVDTAGKRPHAWVQGPTGAGTDLERQKAGIRQGALFRQVGARIEVFHCPSAHTVTELGQVVYRSYSIGDGANGLGRQVTYTPALKYSDIFQPSTKYVFVEDADSRGNGSWVINPLGESWVDPLAVWHSKSRSTLGYADGHADTHRWVDRSTLDMAKNQVFFSPVPANEGEDLRFMIGGFPQKGKDSKGGQAG